MKVKEIIKMLEANGWCYASERGDHMKYKKAGARRPIIVCGHMNDDMHAGTAANILREAGIKFDFQSHGTRDNVK